MNLITVTKNKGHYNFLDLNETGIAYDFYGLPEELSHRSIIVPDKYEFDFSALPDSPEYSVLQFAKDLHNAIIQYYFWTSKTHSLELIIKYLEENEEEQEKLFLENYVGELKDKKEKMMQEYLKLSEIIERYEKQISNWNKS